MDWYLKVFSNYATFEGRARRAEYWTFYFLHLAVLFGCILLDSFTQKQPGLFTFAYIAGSLVPGLAVTVRRLHDTGRSGWSLLLNFIPLIGGLLVFVYTVTDSEPGSNRFGPNPKADSPADDQVAPSPTPPPSPDVSHRTNPCPHCGVKNEAGVSYCIHCGRSIHGICTRCQTKNSPDSEFCKHCGCRLNPA